MNLSKLWKIVEDRGAWCAEAHGVTVRHDLTAEQRQPTSNSITCQLKLKPDLKKDNKNASIQNCNITISRIYF